MVMEIDLYKLLDLILNNSRFVRVSSVGLPTLDYLDNDGNFKSEYTSSLPQIGSGSNQGAIYRRYR